MMRFNARLPGPRPHERLIAQTTARGPWRGAFAYHHPGKYLSTQKDWQQEAENFEFTSLNAKQLAEIYTGKYPTNYEEDFIHLRNIPTSRIKKIWKRFERNGEE